MSTRSAIIQKTNDGYEGVYCHFDGYLEGVGQTLFDHYQDPDKVKKLISLGELSSLGELVEPTEAHSFDEPQKRVTVAYGRDRGETGDRIASIKGQTIKDVASRIGHNGYVYVFDGNKWTINGDDLGEALKAT